MSDSPIYDKLLREASRRHAPAKVTTHWGMFQVNLVRDGYGASWGLFKTAAEAIDSARRAVIQDLTRLGVIR